MLVNQPKRCLFLGLMRLLYHTYANNQAIGMGHLYMRIISVGKSLRAPKKISMPCGKKIQKMADTKNSLNRVKKDQ
jgi:hypothetical protein